MKPIKLIVKTNSEKYPIIIGRNLISNLSRIFKTNSINFKKCLLVLDKNIPNKYVKQISRSLKRYEVYKFIYNANEKNKNQKNVNKILDLLLQKNFSRDDCLISIGGGITGDVAGFAASLFKRGLKFVNIPTTLLSQVDSSVGGKTGINTSEGKNLIGSFYQPKIVISDVEILKSLPFREVVCGYAEIVKHALIRDLKFFEWLEKNFKKLLNLDIKYLEKAIYKSIMIKLSYVNRDPKENLINHNSRSMLNFGHTVGHALETFYNYNKKINHGEAISIGMIAEAHLSNKLGYLPESNLNRIIKHFTDVKLKINDKNIKNKKLINFILKDKKNSDNKINIVLLKKIGKSFFGRKIDIDLIQNIIKNI